MVKCEALLTAMRGEVRTQKKLAEPSRSIYFLRALSPSEPRLSTPASALGPAGREMGSRMSTPIAAITARSLGPSEVRTAARCRRLLRVSDC